MSWTLLESDPGVFAELAASLGARIDVEELYTLDLGCLDPADTLGLLFLFKWTGRRPGASAASASSSVSAPPEPPKCVFMTQTATNACGTIGLLHVLLNSNHEVGPLLADFRSFVADMDGKTAGSCLAAHEGIRAAHNAFARPEAFAVEEDARAKREDAFHFVAFVPIGGRVVELDGLSAGPVDIGSAAPSDAFGMGAGSGASAAGGEGAAVGWLAAAQRALQARIAEYDGSGELRFTLLSVVRSRRERLLQQVADTASALDAALGALLSIGAAEVPEAAGAEQLARRFGCEALPPPSAAAEAAAEAEVARLLVPAPGVAPVPASAPEAPEAALLHHVRILERRLEECAESAMAERERAARFRAENERRRHQFVPFILELLRGLAERDLLQPMYERGTKRAVEARERARLGKAARKEEVAKAAAGH